MPYFSSRFSISIAKAGYKYAVSLLVLNIAAAGLSACLLAPPGETAAPVIPLFRQSPPHPKPLWDETMPFIKAKMLEYKKARSIFYTEYDIFYANITNISAWMNQNRATIEKFDLLQRLSCARFYTHIYMLIRKLKIGALLQEQRHAKYSIGEYIVNRLKDYPQYDNFVSEYRQGAGSHLREKPDAELFENMLTAYLAGMALGSNPFDKPKSLKNGSGANCGWRFPLYVFYDESWIIDYHLRNISNIIFGEKSVLAANYQNIAAACKKACLCRFHKLLSGRAEDSVALLKILMPVLCESYNIGGSLSLLQETLEYEAELLNQSLPHLDRRSKLSEADLREIHARYISGDDYELLTDYRIFLLAMMLIADSRDVKPIIKKELMLENSIDSRMKELKHPGKRYPLILAGAGYTTKALAEKLNIVKSTLLRLRKIKSTHNSFDYRRLSAELTQRYGRPVSAWYITASAMPDELFDNSKTLGDRLHICRLLAGFTQEEVVVKINEFLKPYKVNIALDTYNKIENGGTLPHDPQFYFAAAQIFNARKILARELTPLDLLYGIPDDEFFSSLYARHPEKGGLIELSFIERLEAIPIVKFISWNELERLIDYGSLNENDSLRKKIYRLRRRGSAKLTAASYLADNGKKFGQALSNSFIADNGIKSKGRPSNKVKDKFWPKFLNNIVTAKGRREVDISMSQLLYGMELFEMLSRQPMLIKRLKLVREDLGLSEIDMADKIKSLLPAEHSRLFKRVISPGSALVRLESSSSLPLTQRQLIYARLHNALRSRKLDGCLLLYGIKLQDLLKNFSSQLHESGISILSQISDASYEEQMIPKLPFLARHFKTVAHTLPRPRVITNPASQSL